MCRISAGRVLLSLPGTSVRLGNGTTTKIKPCLEGVNEDLNAEA